MKFRFEKRKMHLTVTSLQCPCLNLLMIAQGHLMKTKPTKSQKPIKKRPRQHGETRCIQTILRFRNGCKNSGRTWWMMKFRYREALTPVLLVKFLDCRQQGDVRIWASTVFMLISLKTEIARSVNGPKLQGPRQKMQWRSRTSSRKFR